MSFDIPGKVPSDEDFITALQSNSLHKRRGEEAFFRQYLYFTEEGQRKYHLSEDESFDAYADAVLYAIDNISKGRFESRSSLKTYLYRIFSNKCVDLVRKKTTNKNSVHQTSTISDMLLLLADPSRTVVEALMEKNDREVLKNKLGLLGENCKKLLDLFAEAYSDSEIAVLMEYKSADVAKTSRLRCLDKLRQLFTSKK